MELWAFLSYNNIELLKYLYTENEGFSVWSLSISPLENAQNNDLKNVIIYLNTI